MKRILFTIGLLFLLVLGAQAQAPRVVFAYENGQMATHTNLFFTNLFVGTNMGITRGTNGTLTFYCTVPVTTNLVDFTNQVNNISNMVVVASNYLYLSATNIGTIVSNQAIFYVGSSSNSLYYAITNGDNVTSNRLWTSIGSVASMTNSITNVANMGRSINMNALGPIKSKWESNSLIHIGILGDSLGTRMLDTLPMQFSSRGWRFAGMRGTLGNSAYGNVNYADAYGTNFSDQSTIPGLGAWPVWQLMIWTNGGVFFRDASAGNFPWTVNRLGVHYMVGPTMGTISVLVGPFAGTKTNFATINATSGGVTAGHTDFAITPGNFTVILSTTTSNIITGIDLWQTNAVKGFTINGQSVALHPTAQYIAQIPVATATNYFFGNQVDLLWWENTDSPSSVQTNLPIAYSNAIRWMCPTGVIVFSSHAPQISKSVADSLEEAGYVRDVAVLAGMPFFDKFRALGGETNKIVQEGYLLAGDGTHPTALANETAFRVFSLESGFPPFPLIPTNTVDGYNFGQFTIYDTNSIGGITARIGASDTNFMALWLSPAAPTKTNASLWGYSLGGSGPVITAIRGQGGVQFESDPTNFNHGYGFLWPSGGWSFMDMWYDTSRLVDPGTGTVIFGSNSTFRFQPSSAVLNYVLTCTNIDGSAAWRMAPSGGSTNGPVASFVNGQFNTMTVTGALNAIGGVFTPTLWATQQVYPIITSGPTLNLTLGSQFYIQTNAAFAVTFTGTNLSGQPIRLIVDSTATTNFDISFTNSILASLATPISTGGVVATNRNYFQWLYLGGSDYSVAFGTAMTNYWEQYSTNMVAGTATNVALALLNPPLRTNVSYATNIVLSLDRTTYMAVTNNATDSMALALTNIADGKTFTFRLFASSTNSLLVSFLGPGVTTWTWGSTNSTSSGTNLFVQTGKKAWAVGQAWIYSGTTNVDMSVHCEGD